jgi:hypothetical protein
MSVDYTPPPTIERFMMDDTSRLRCVVGPLGSGKSMGCIMETLRRSVQQAPHVETDEFGNKVRNRYSRWAIVRNTAAQLRATVLADVRQYLGPMISYYVTDSTIKIRAKLDDGTTVVSDWLLIPLDTAEDQKRLLSLQLTGAWINELREVPIDIIDPLLGRLGRYPAKMQGGPTWHGLIADTNPWDTDSPYHEALVVSPTKGWNLYHQPSGIGPDAENVENLPPGYYEGLVSGRDQDWIDVHVRSQWGVSNAGQAVFRRSFHIPTHVRDLKPVLNPFRPLIIGQDFGRTPTALIGQVDEAGRLIIHKEVVTEDMGLIQMLKDHLKPALMAPPFAGMRHFMVADPAGTHKGQSGERSLFDDLKDAGFLAYPASTNQVDPRLTAVEKLLQMNIMGQPALQISREGCPQLVRAMASKYRYKRKRGGALDDAPEKLHPWSDLVDCLQYMALGCQSNLTGKVLMRDRPKTPRAAMPAAAWT